MLALCYYCSFLFEQSEAGLKVLGVRQYGFDSEWLRQKCGLMEVAPNEFVRGQSVLASVDNERFFSGIFCVFLSYICSIFLVIFFFQILWFETVILLYCLCGFEVFSFSLVQINKLTRLQEYAKEEQLLLKKSNS